MDEMSVLTPIGCIGNRGIYREALLAALDAEKPDVIASDAGSLDEGPWYLGTGHAHSPMANIRRDLDLVLTEAVRRGIPLIIGTSGGSGARPHVDLFLKTAKEIAQQRKLDFKVGTIYSDVDKDYLIRRIRKGDAIRKVPTSIFGDLATEEEVKKCSNIVAMMGVEPMIEALKQGAQVILAGRAADCCVMAAYPIMKGFDRGLSLHMGDVMECGELALVDRAGVTKTLAGGTNRVPIIGAIRKDHFLIKPGHPGMACTVESASAHSLYERENYAQIELPGGVLDKAETTIEQETDEIVKVRGTRFIEKPYTVLLEGAGLVGWRTISILGVRNHRTIAHIDEVLAQERRSVEERFSELGDFTIYFHVYGKGVILGPSEPEKDRAPQELGIVIDVVAESQSLANDIAEDLTLKIAFSRYQGRTTTAGNVAYLTSPNVIDVGEAHAISIYHQLPIEDPLELFKINVQNIHEVQS